MGSHNRIISSDSGSKIADAPDKPTIGTATVDGCSAFVPVTAAPTGGVPTLYTATSTPGGLTGTSTSSPVQVINLVPSTSYTFTVSAQSANGLAGPATDASNSITAGNPSLYAALSLSSSYGLADVNTSTNEIYFTGYDYSSSPYKPLFARYNTSLVEQWENELVPPSQNVNFENCLVDTNGNTYFFGNDSNNADALVVKMNSSGTFQWGRRSGNSTNTQYYYKGFVDSSENVYAIGYYYGGSGSTYFGHISKYNSGGSHQWTYRLGRTFSNTPTFLFGVWVDSSGNEYYSGRHATSSDYYFMIVKANNGSKSWELMLQHSSANQSLTCWGVTTDSSGNVYGVGTADGTPKQLMTVKTNSSGTLQWQRAITKTNVQDQSDYSGTACDSSGNVYSAWTCDSTLGGPGNYRYIILNKRNSSGTVQWTRKISLSNADLELRGRRLKIVNDIVYMTLWSNSNPIIFSVSLNTDKLGTYTVGSYVLTYANDSGWSDAATSHTTQSPNIQLSNPSFTDNTTTYTTTSSTNVSAVGLIRF